MHEVGTHLPFISPGRCLLSMLHYNRRGWYECLGVVWEWRTLRQWWQLHDGICKDCIFRTSRLQDLKISRLETRIQYTLLGEGRLSGTLEKPVVGRDAWRSAMTSCGKLHPDSKRRKNTSCPEAYLCNRKSLWALAWLTLVVTLAGTVLADVELR